MAIPLLLTIYCICVVAASLAGGALPRYMKLTHRRMQLVMSFVGGLMLGVALLHLIPHSLAQQGSIDRLSAWTLAGLVTMFLLIRVFHVHAHEHGECGPPLRGRADASATAGKSGEVESPFPHSNHLDAQSIASHHDHIHTVPAYHPFSWVGLALGLSLHTLIDGLALGAAVVAEAHEQQNWALYGFATFLAVALHKPLDALSITSLMAAGGWSKESIQAANGVFALMCPLGAILFVIGVPGLFAEQQGLAIGCALAFAAGVFLCISLADLLPEVAFHTHDRASLTLALFTGIALAWAIGFLEPKHVHESHHPGKSVASSRLPVDD